MSVNWSTLLTASLVIFSLHKYRYCYGLEWNAHSLLQPGPCPTPSGLTTSFDVQQMKGSWNIVQLPRQFPTCCRQPTLDVADVAAVNLQPKTSTNDTHSGVTMKVAVDWSSCSTDGTDQRKTPLSFRLRTNAMASSTLLMELPWPFNIAGFATLNVISTDYKSYAAGYVCHSLLLEHISIPFTLGRLNMDIDVTQIHRFKWSLVKQGVLAAWDLTDTVSVECNALPLPATQSLEEVIVHASSSTTGVPSSHAQEQAPNAEDAGVSSEIETSSISSGNEAAENVTYDPDADAEWITTDSNQVKPQDGDHPISFPDDLPVPPPTAYPVRPGIPGSYPGLGGIWPSILFGQRDPEEGIGLVTDRYEPDLKLVTFVVDPLEDGKMAHFEKHQSAEKSN